MDDHADAMRCFELVEESLNRFLALFALDCILWPPALERVAADLEALREPHPQAEMRSAAVQRRMYLDD